MASSTSETMRATIHARSGNRTKVLLAIATACVITLSPFKAGSAFAWNQIEPSKIGQVEKYDFPINDWLGLKFESGQSYTLGRAVSEFTEDTIYDDGNITNNVDVLNNVFGIPGRLTFDKPMSIQRARLINERKQKEIEMSARLGAAAHDAFSFKGVAGFLAYLAGHLGHPLDFGLIGGLAALVWRYRKSISPPIAEPTESVQPTQPAPQESRKQPQPETYDDSIGP